MARTRSQKNVSYLSQFVQCLTRRPLEVAPLPGSYAIAAGRLRSVSSGSGSRGCAEQISSPEPGGWPSSAAPGFESGRPEAAADRRAKASRLRARLRVYVFMANCFAGFANQQPGERRRGATSFIAALNEKEFWRAYLRRLPVGAEWRIPQFEC